MIAKEDETNITVTREDQEQICEFGSTNSRIKDLKERIESLTSDMRTYEDAEEELMLVEDDSEEGVRFTLGDCYVPTDGDAAQEILEALTEEATAKKNELEKEVQALEREQEIRKEELYAKLGKSIQLEN